MHLFLDTVQWKKRKYTRNDKNLPLHALTYISYFSVDSRNTRTRNKKTANIESALVFHENLLTPNLIEINRSRFQIGVYSLKIKTFVSTRMLLSQNRNKRKG